MESNYDLVEKYIAYSHKEKAYIKYFRASYKGGCDFTNSIEKANDKYTALELKELLQENDVDYCEIIRIYVLENTNINEF